MIAAFDPIRAALQVMLHEARELNTRVLREAGIGPFDLNAIHQAEAALEPERPLDVRMEHETSWPLTREVGRLGDMTPPGESHLRVLFDSDNDVIVEVLSIRHGHVQVAGVEFCGGMGGGGQSLETRKALIALMVAMEADNAKTPHKDWLAARARLSRAESGGNSRPTVQP